MASRTRSDGEGGVDPLRPSDHIDSAPADPSIVQPKLGVVFIGQVSFLQRTVKPGWQPRTGLIGAPLLGVIFAIGWTPCVGPTLVAVTSLVLNQGDLGRAVILGIAYCVGLGVPFLLVAIGFGWVGASVRFVKRHIRAINIAGGVLLVVVGVLMVSGVWGLVVHSIGAGTDVPL